MEKHVTPLGLVDGYTSFLQICHPSGIFSHGIEKPPAERFEARFYRALLNRSLRTALGTIERQPR